jgi:spore germination protein GerM
MFTLRIALVAAFALLVAACGSALADSDGVDSGLPDPDATETTTTLPGPEIEDPPLPTAPPSTADPDVTTTPPDPEIEYPPSTAAPDTTDVLVYFVVEPESGIDGTDFGCGLAAAVTRRVQSPEILSGAIETLLAGPTDAESEAGYGTILTDEVGWELASVTISDGTALIDFSEDSQPFNNMSASCVHLALMTQLEATATQFSTVDRAVFSVGGDIPTFYHWLERDVPEL